MHNLFIGRQPICDKNLDIFAYELLFRSSDTDIATITDGDHATTEVILNAFTEIGLDRIVGKHLAFINVTRSFVLGEYPLPNMKDRIVLEFLEDIEVDEEILTAAHNLANQGYKIALDDFIYCKKLQDLVEVADYIKIDILALGKTALEEHVRLLRNTNTKLIAEKIETQKDFEYCVLLGFDYFQGYFFRGPNVISSNRVPTSVVASLDLLAQLFHSDINAQILEKIIRKDMALSMRLLRYINAAHTLLNMNVDSIAHVIELLGVNTTRTVISMLVLARIDEKPYQLITTALIRAKMCELIISKKYPGQKDAYFTLGLFSNLETMMELPMSDIFGHIVLDDDIKQALLPYHGDMGSLLKCIIDYEQGKSTTCNCSISIAPETLFDTYLEALAWANEVSKALTQH